MVLNIIAFYKRICLKNSTFQGILRFSFCLLVVEVFE